MFIVTETWKTNYPKAAVGILVMKNVSNPKHHPALAARKAELENQLRTRFADYDRSAIKAIPTIQAYSIYYRRFRKTYHVQLQLESVAQKGKSIPRVAALVEAMFMAELKNLMLTAGHDLDVAQQPIRIDVADGSERYVLINGQEQVLKAGDMYIADAQGVISSIIYGPDRRTQITAKTRQAIFTVYAPEGIEQEAVRRHLKDMRDNVMLVTPEAEVTELEVYTAD